MTPAAPQVLDRARASRLGAPAEELSLGPTPTVNEAVARCGKLPAVVAGSTNEAPPTVRAVDAEGVAYQVTEQRRRVVNDVVEHVFLQDMAGAGVWPGQVVQGKSLLQGDVAPVGPLRRRPGTITVVTDIITSQPASRSKLVNSPDAARITEARLAILRALKPKGSAGLLKVDYQAAHTYREVGAKLGLQVTGPTFGVDANASLNGEYRQSTVVAVIRQVYYTVTFAPKTGQASGIWPTGTASGAIKASALKPYIGPGNPPLLVDSVHYGRFICVTAQSAHSSFELAAAVRASWDAAVSGAGGVDAHTKEVLDSSEVKIFTIGADGDAQFQDIADPVADLNAVYRAGLKFSLANPGAPVAFTCRHLTDATLAHVGVAASYIHPLDATGVDYQSVEPFHVWDGPGGGLRDTGVRCNAGDHVKISAGGQIWAGVWGTGTNGPEGWPGWKADPAAPKPDGTANALIIRFGSAPGTWIEAGSFWEGSPAPGSSGVLQLNTNDNNPYNGDPKKHWTVDVSVHRKGAAAAGVFV